MFGGQILLMASLLRLVNAGLIASFVYESSKVLQIQTLAFMSIDTCWKAVAQGNTECLLEISKSVV